MSSSLLSLDEQVSEAAAAAKTEGVARGADASQRAESAEVPEVARKGSAAKHGTSQEKKRKQAAKVRFVILLPGCAYPPRLVVSKGWALYLR